MTVGARAGSRGRLSLAVLALIGAMATAACSNVPVHRTLPVLNLGEPSFFPTIEAHAQAPIVGFVRSTAGLMANLSVDGTKFTKIAL